MTRQKLISHQDQTTKVLVEVDAGLGENGMRFLKTSSYLLQYTTYDNDLISWTFLWIIWLVIMLSFELEQSIVISFIELLVWEETTA